MGFLGVFIYLGKMALKDQTANLTTYLHAYIQFYQAFSILQVHITVIKQQISKLKNLRALPEIKESCRCAEGREDAV